MTSVQKKKRTYVTRNVCVCVCVCVPVFFLLALPPWSLMIGCRCRYWVAHVLSPQLGQSTRSDVCTNVSIRLGQVGSVSGESHWCTGAVAPTRRGLLHCQPKKNRHKKNSRGATKKQFLNKQNTCTLKYANVTTTSKENLQFLGPRI